MIRTMLGAVTLSGMVILSGCGGGDENMTRDQQFEQLLQRPHLDEISQTYQQIQRDIANQLSAEMGLPSWSTAGSGGGSLCGHEFKDIGGAGGTKTLSIMGTLAPIPDEQWDRAVDIADAVTNRNGFGPAQRLLDRPGHHTAEFHDAWGGRLTISTQVNTSLSVRTGCHLKPEAHQRSTPTTRPDNGR